MTMKVVINDTKQNQKKAANQVPIPFKKAEFSQSDGKCLHEVTAHEVHYDSMDANSQAYKVYLEPFDSDTPEQAVACLFRQGLAHNQWQWTYNWSCQV